MDHNILAMLAVGGGAGIVGTALSKGWGAVKGLATKVSGLLVIRISCVYGTGIAAEQLLWQEFRTYRSAFMTYGQSHVYHLPQQAKRYVFFETTTHGSRIFWRGWRPLVYSQAWDKDRGHYTTHLSFLRWTFDPDALMDRARVYYDERNNLSNPRFAVYTILGKGRSALGAVDKEAMGAAPQGPPPAPDTDWMRGRLIGNVRKQDIGLPVNSGQLLRDLALPPDAEEAVGEAQRWLQSGPWYRRRNIPWRRGYLLYGDPGTGKSALAVSLAKDMNLPLYRLDLSSMCNKELTDAWKMASANTPAVVLLEDIDNVFHGRENVVGEVGGGLNFDHLLNTVSGVDCTDGILLIITTNKLEHIDEALGVPAGGGAASTRPGRLDRAVRLAKPDAAGRLKIVRRICTDAPEEELARLVRDTDGATGAQVQERASMEALRRHWEARGPTAS